MGEYSWVSTFIQVQILLLTSLTLGKPLSFCFLIYQKTIALLSSHNYCETKLKKKKYKSA